GRLRGQVEAVRVAAVTPRRGRLLTLGMTEAIQGDDATRIDAALKLVASTVVRARVDGEGAVILDRSNRTRIEVVDRRALDRRGRRNDEAGQRKASRRAGLVVRDNVLETNAPRVESSEALLPGGRRTRWRLRIAFGVALAGEVS